MNMRAFHRGCVALLWLCGAVAEAAQQVPPAAAPAGTPEQRCVALTGLAGPGYEVVTAQWMPAQRLESRNGAPAMDLPAHCLFRITVGARESTIPDMKFGTGIELRLPAQWNQRLLFQGGGGLDGVLLPAIGGVGAFPPALARGFAVVSTDSGHRGRGPMDARFAADQQAKLDFAWQSLQTTTREAKSLLRRYYGREPEHSYFMGCSTGGREAMMVAQRLPLEFDGVVAGNATFNLTRIAANQVFSLQTVTGIAPRDEQGRPQLFRAFTDAQLRAVADAVLQQCDDLDGLRDGMINDYRACRFDPRSRVCKAGVEDVTCLTAQQAEALSAIFGGARNSRGESLYGRFAFDTGIASPAWRSMHLGSEGGPPANATLGRDTLREFALTPPDPEADPLRFDFDRDMIRTTETAAINDAVATLLTSFAARGSKLIVYHGLSDQAMATGALTDWYERLMPRTTQGPQQWARLFLVPGMLHCGGGQSTDQFDMLDAIQNWVERGLAPERVIATGRNFPGVSRPLCPYPKVARYDGGNEKSAESFSCR